VRALVPPTQRASFPHDDWVADVDVLPAGLCPKGSELAAEGRILSAGYDGVLRVWHPARPERPLAASRRTTDSAAAQAIKAAKFLAAGSVVAAGNDRCVRLWRYEEEEPPATAMDGDMELDGEGAPPGRFAPQLEMYGHRASVDSIAVHASSGRVLSASADHTVGLWTTRKADLPPAPEGLLPAASVHAGKRRKIEGGGGQTVRQGGPLALFKAHSAPVSAAVFAAHDATVAHSASWDHALATWDLTTAGGAPVTSRRTMHPLLSLAELPGLGVLAAGSSARHVSVVDPRVDARDVAALTLRGHGGAVVALAPQPGLQWGLVSGSLDGTCRVWDLRSARVDAAATATAGQSGKTCESVYVVRREGQAEGKRVVGGEGVKVFAVAWDARLGIVSAGEDRRVQVNAQPSLGA
jgi:ribosome biogenesis protein YTM1